MKEKVLKKILTLFLVLAVLVNTINVPMLVHAYELTINNITWGTGDNDKVLSWDPVDGAVSYTITIPGGGGTNTILTSADCSHIINKTGTHTPTVRAYDENRVLIAEAQGPEKYFEIPQISNPSNIKIENGIVTWDAVPNAGSYNAAIYRYDSEGNAYYSGYHTYINSNRILLSSIAAWLVEGETYAIGIQAYPTYNSGYGDSEETRYTFVFQGYPVIDVININITWGTGENDKVLYWDPVEGAVKYTVTMGSSGANCYTTSLDCKRMIKGEGTYTPTVIAYDEYGKKIVETKGPEKYFTVPKLATPGNVKIENNMVTWDAVANASEYRVSLYRYDEETDSGYYVNHFYASEKTNMSLSLYALEDGMTYFATVIARDMLNYEFGESKPGNSEHFVYEITHVVNTAVAGSGGTVSASATVKHHGDYVVTLKPKKGYVIDYLTVNGIDVTAEIVSNKYTISDITSDQTVEVGFSTCRHDWVAGEVTKESTCKEAGEQTYTCSVCEETKVEFLPKLSIHTWNAGEVYVEPTCGASGLFRYTCEVCEITKDEILAKNNNHDFGEYAVITEATCGNGGIKSRTCAICRLNEEALIPASGNHTFTKKIMSNEYLLSEADFTAPAKYYYACEVCGQKGTKTYSYGSKLQLATPKLSAPTVNEKSIVVKWGKVTDAALYRVYRKNEAGSWAKLNDVKTTSFEDTDVESGKSYTYTVKCVSADGKISTSAFDTTGVTATYCSMPELKSATPSEEGAKVTWNKVTGAGAYRVYRKVSGGSWAKVGDTTATSYVDKTAVSGTTYIYTVRCMDASKTVSTSVYDKNGISITYCSVPAIKSMTVNNDGIKVTWGAVTGAAKYRVYRKINDAGSWKKLGVVATLSYTDKTATPGAKYTYTIMCVNADDTVNYSTYDKLGKSVFACTNPVLKSTTTLDGAVKVTWGKVTGASGYRVYRKIAGGSWKAVGDTKEVSFNDTTVESGTKYIYSVRCLDADGTTCISGYDTTGITVLYCAMPKITTLTSTTKGVKATWGAVTGAAKYRVYRKVPGGSWAKVTDTTATSYVDTTAVKGTQYVYTVRCLDADGKTFVSAYDTTGKTITFK